MVKIAVKKISRAADGVIPSEEKQQDIEDDGPEIVPLNKCEVFMVKI